MTPKFNTLPFHQLLTPPFRAETGVPRNLLPIYSATTPPPPPYLPMRKLSYYPRYAPYKQLNQVITSENLKFTGGD